MIKHTDSPRRSLQLCQNPHSYFRPLFNWSGRLWYEVGLHPLKALKFLNLFAFLLCTKIQPVENSRSSRQSCQYTPGDDKRTCFAAEAYQEGTSSHSVFLNSVKSPVMLFRSYGDEICQALYGVAVRRIVRANKRREKMTRVARTRGRYFQIEYYNTQQTKW